MSAPTLLRRLLLSTPTLLGVVLILLIALSFASQTIDWLALNRTPTTVLNSETAELAAAPELTSIETLFGAARRDDTAAPPATNLRLTLRGSFLHSNAKNSSAIIQREGGKPQRFAIGAEVDKGVRLHAVYRDRVEIERNGRRETLMFSKRAGGTGGNQALYEAPAGGNQPIYEGPVDDLSTLQQEEEQRLRERLENMRQQMESAGSQTESEPTDAPEPPTAPPKPHTIEPPTESE